MCLNLHILFDYEHEYGYTRGKDKTGDDVPNKNNNYQGHELWFSLYIYPQS